MGMGGRQRGCPQSAPGVIVTAGHSCFGSSFLWQFEKMQKVHRAWLVLVCSGPKPEVTEGLCQGSNSGLVQLRSTDLGQQAEVPGPVPSAGHHESPGESGRWGRSPKAGAHVGPDRPRPAAAASSWFPVFCLSPGKLLLCSLSVQKRTQNK